MKLSELATLTGARIETDAPDIEILGAAGLDDATNGQVTFLANPRYTPRVSATLASAIYVAEDAQIEKNIPVLRARDPYLAYTRALRLFHPEPEQEPFIHPTAVIDTTAQISQGVSIGACVVIGRNVEIAEGVVIYANVTVYDAVKIGRGSVIHSGVAIRERSIIGERVVVHNNVVIGCDGFGYAKDEARHWLKIPQAGRVVIEDDVEIGAGTTIDRASVGESRVAGHLTIGDDVVLTAKSATSHDVQPGKIISGIPAFDNRDWLRATAAFRRLGEMQRTVRELERRLKELDSAAEKES